METPSTIKTNIKNNLVTKKFKLKIGNNFNSTIIQKPLIKNQHHTRFHKPNQGVISRKPLEDEINLSS